MFAFSLTEGSKLLVALDENTNIYIIQITSLINLSLTTSRHTLFLLHLLNFLIIHKVVAGNPSI